MAIPHTRLTAIDITTYQEKQQIVLAGLIGNLTFGTARNGQPYISCTIIDKSKRLEAKQFNTPPLSHEQVEQYTSSIILFFGSIHIFNEQYTMNIETMQPLSADDLAELNYSLDTFRDVVENRQELAAKLTNYMNMINNTVYGQIALKAIQDNWAAFSNTPAATGYHHTSIGGLLQHTIEVVEYAESLYQTAVKLDYGADLNHSLIIAGALLHDIGKCRELQATPAQTYEYSPISTIAPHILLSCNMVTTAATQLNLQDSIELAELCHIIATHHGTVDMGNMLKDLNMPEAVIVSSADNLSAKINVIKLNFSTVQRGTAGQFKQSRYFRSTGEKPIDGTQMNI